MSIAAVDELPALAVARVEGLLDRTAGFLGSLTDRVPRGPVRDALNGTWLGHPLHPVLTDAAIGAWTCSSVLDVVGGRRGADASTTLVGVGVLAAVPAAATGAIDWSDTTGEDRRLGALHAVGNIAVTGLYAMSWLARRRGHRGAGVVLGLAGGSLATATAYVGGHLVFRRGIGIDRTAFDRFPKRWTATVEESSLDEGKPVRAEVGDVGVCLIRIGDRIHALHDRCSHLGGPLHEGSVDDGCITCPWHGSTFRLEDGRVVRGPATAPQPSLETRVQDGTVEVRRRAAQPQPT